MKQLGLDDVSSKPTRVPACPFAGRRVGALAVGEFHGLCDNIVAMNMNSFSDRLEKLSMESKQSVITD
eukprot:2489016-Karenia_brevis.AAC.1